jgi:ABC-type phosphate/phosphonate transport system substrate-binding protein
MNRSRTRLYSVVRRDHMTRTLSSRLRAAALVGAAAIAASSLVACSGDKKESAPNTLTLLSSFTSGEATGKEFNTLAQKFTEQTGIKIDVQEVNTNDIAGTYESSKLANKERDLVILNLTSTIGASRRRSSRRRSSTGRRTARSPAYRSSASTGRFGTTWTCSRRPASTKSRQPSTS